MTVYSSPYAPLDLPQCSIFSLVFAMPDRHRWEKPMFIDAASGEVFTRRAFHTLALSLAKGATSYQPPEPHASFLGSILPKRGLPLSQGQVALIFAPNAVSYAIAFYGLQAAGIITTLANSTYTPRELAHQLRDSGAEVAFVHPALLPVLQEAWKLLGVDAAAQSRRTVVIDWVPGSTSTAPDPAWSNFTSFNKLLTLGKLDRPVAIDGKKAISTTALMCYSSGTTGLAKGVESTHYNATSMVVMTKTVLPWFENDVALSVLPMFHIFGAVLNTLYWPTFGVPVVIQGGPFSPDVFCANIAKYRVTTSFVVPPILLAMAKHPAPAKHDVSSLRNLTSGAAPLSASLVDSVVTRLTGLGCQNLVITQGYGLTETSPTVFYLSEHDAMRKVGTCGVQMPNLEVRLIADGPWEKDAKEGEPGEVWVRGPSIMKGYLRNPLATANIMTRDGFFKTGDIATRDSEGYYTIVDRKKELIKYKGFQVPPAELEALLVTNPEVADAAVIGIYSTEQETELPRAYIVPAAGLASFETPDAKVAFEKKITEWVTSQVAQHKRLRGGVVAIDLVPKSAAGKILRRELRERVTLETGLDPVTGLPVKAKSKL